MRCAHAVAALLFALPLLHCKPAPTKCEPGWTYNEKLNKCYKALLGLYDWDSAYAACRQQRAHLPSIQDDAENLAFSEVAQDYPMVILGLRNNAVAPWSEKPMFSYEWADGSFFHYSQLPEPDDDTPQDFKCAYFETGQTAAKPHWVLMNCRKPASMATAVCQRSPKDV